MPERASLARRGAARASLAAGWRLTRLSRRLASPPSDAVGERTLAGDRDVEWAWALAHLRAEPGRVLDLGAGHGFLSLAAAFRGHEVVAVDLEPERFAFRAARIDYRRGDFNELRFPSGFFDQVLNCSTIEHFGLGGRYGSGASADADLVAMSRLRDALSEAGTMVLTIPVGRDAVFAPYHRVYGDERLPRLLERFGAVRESYFAKVSGERWEEVERERALAEQGSARYYALGLFVLEPR